MPKKVPTAERLSEMNRVAREMGAKLTFDAVLGSGAGGTVFRVSMKAPPPKAKPAGCDGAPPSPAVKVNYGTEAGQREFRLARWASEHGVGPKVFCDAVWEGEGKSYHLSFMEPLWGSLHDAAEERSTPLPVLQALWFATFEEVVKVAALGLLGADLKPDNVLVDATAGSTGGDTVTGVELADWDPSFWVELTGDDRTDRALLFNYVCLLSNTVFILAEARLHYTLCQQLPPLASRFTRELLRTWVDTSGFRKWLVYWDAALRKGVYHYAFRKLSDAERQRLKGAAPVDRAKAYVARIRALAAKPGGALRGLGGACGSGEVVTPYGERALELAHRRFGAA